MISAGWAEHARLANLAITALLLFTLWRRGITGRRPFFAAYLLGALLRGVILSFIPNGRTLYGWVYLTTEPIIWLFYVLIVIEIFGSALRQYRGVAALSRWVLAALLLVSVTLSVISLVPDLNSDHPFPIVHLVTAAGRAICTSLALFLLGITLFFLSYPIPLSRNTIIHSAICSAYFLIGAAGYFVHNVVGPSSWAVVNLALVVITAATLLAWILFLRPEGERIIVEHRPQWSPETEEELLNRLNALNSVLARSLRK
jgi:hypothetical protein